jgi:hypothetical protein
MVCQCHLHLVSLSLISRDNKLNHLLRDITPKAAVMA